MEKIVTSTVVAREFFDIASFEELDVTPLELIKFTFLAHGWSYVHLEERLVGEPVEAWPYGPVFRSLYNVLKHWGGEPVQEVPRSTRERFSKDKVRNLNKKERDLIKSIYNSYKEYGGPRLITLTHKRGSPWHKTQLWDVIKESDIREYYKLQAQAQND